MFLVLIEIEPPIVILVGKNQSKSPCDMTLECLFTKYQGLQEYYLWYDSDSHRFRAPFHFWRKMRERKRTPSKGGEEFKFWDRIFDGHDFLYDHINSKEDVEKANTMGAQKLLQGLGIYFMRSCILGCAFVWGSWFFQPIWGWTKAWDFSGKWGPSHLSNSPHLH